jgi:hypothetical protein
MVFLKKTANLFFRYFKNDLHVLRTCFRRDSKNQAVQASWEGSPVGFKSYTFQDLFNITSSNEQTAKIVFGFDA